MPCYCPRVAYYSRDRGSSGKRAITFQRKFAGPGAPLTLPCGQCVGCRLERSRQWAMRCLHESKMHEHNEFITLTYDNENLPPGGTLVKRDFQLFMKRLRKEFSSEKGNEDGIRFYACGEYGDLNKRPHYHAILFNILFPDKIWSGQNGRGDKYYVSSQLSEIWGLGRALIGEVNFETAAYVARYVLKKITGEGAAAHYEVMDGNGEVFDRLPEFTLMSRRPGVGSEYYDRYGREVRDHDSVVINNREVRPPRFYDTRFEAIDPVRYDQVKKKRRKMALLLKADNTVDRRRVKEVLALKLLQKKARTL